MSELNQLSTKLTAEENLVKTAFNAGVPRDQLESFLQHGYVPLPWQFKFHATCRGADNDGGPTEIGVGGARGPGKSHAVFSQLCLDDCQRVGGLKGLFLRKTGKASKESRDDLVFKTIAGRIKFEQTQDTIRFPNGSRVVLGGFENEKDIDKYIGIEYDVIAVEEENQLTREKIDKLKGSLRTSKANWRPRLYSSFNPGGIGHLFIKQLFIDPFRTNTQKRTRFVPSTYKENPYLNKEYIDYLEGLEGALGKAWREGDWDSFEGQYFGNWSHEHNVVRPFEIPPAYKRFRAYDHGRRNPACCKWYALDYDGRVFAYRELYVTGWNVDQIAAEINRLSEGEIYEYSVADPAIFANVGMVDKYGGQTIAESFARNGIMFIPASNRRVDGWNLMHQYLHWTLEKPAKLIYFNTCFDSIRTIPSLIHSDTKPEDVDTDGEDHAADCDRYMLMSLHERHTPKPLNEVQKKLEQIKKATSKEPWRLYNAS